jgi:DNA-binding response OmpR family regulator
MLTILVIEDEPNFRRFISVVLEHQGYRVIQTSLLYEGLALARREPRPDLVLLDMTLPDGSGLDFLSEPKLADLPIIAMTAMADVDLNQHLQLAATTYFIKPISARQLIELVNHCVTEVQPEPPVRNTRRRR